MLAAAIQQLTGYFTETGRRPVDDVAKSALTGPATVILTGLSVGFESAVYSALLIGAAVFAAFSLGGGSVVLSLFAIALAGTGLLTTVGVIVSMDTFGPVSDNAQGIAEMSGDVTGEGAVILTKLDAVGNTTKAITKGIAIATAVLAATALFGAFRESVAGAAIAAGQSTADAMGNLAQLGQYMGVLDVANPRNLVGLLIGAAVVFLFSGLAINAVSRAAGAVIYEVRRQFRDHPGIMEGTEKPEYGKVVDIVTRDSLRELSTPGLLAMLTPIAVGFGLGVGALGTFLAGTIATGTLMAVFLLELRRRLGQREEVRGGRPHGRQELARACGHRHRRHRRRPVQGHGRPGHQPPAQGDEPRCAAHRPGGRGRDPGWADDVAHRDRPGSPGASSSAR